MQKVTCSHLLLKHTGSRNPFDSYRQKPITRTIQQARSQIKKFQQQIRSGREDFGQLALLYSQCRSAANKGDLGQFFRGDMQKQFEDASFALKVGQLSKPVETDSGVHLILRTA